MSEPKINIIELRHDIKQIKTVIHPEMERLTQQLGEQEELYREAINEYANADENYENLKRLRNLYRKDPTNPDFIQFANITQQDVRNAKEIAEELDERCDDINDTIEQIKRGRTVYYFHVRDFVNKYKNFIETLPNTEKLKLEFMKIAENNGNYYNVDLDYRNQIHDIEEHNKHMSAYKSLRNTSQRALDEPGIRALIASSLHKPIETPQYAKQDALEYTKDIVKKSLIGRSKNASKQNVRNVIRTGIQTRRNIPSSKLEKLGITRSAGGSKNKSRKNKTT